MSYTEETPLHTSLHFAPAVGPDALAQSRAPLFEALRDYVRKDMAPFHTPGHKQGVGIDPEFLELVGRNVFAIDLTELPEVDNLHDPDGVIRQAQELAAEAYGADFTFFLCNGSTSGNDTMIMSVCDPGDKIIIPRNAHKSILGGIILSGATPVYVQPSWDVDYGIAHGISPESVEAALIAHPDAKAVVLVNPNYYGGVVDIEAIAKLAHAHGKPLLVDEAHGPHFNFHPDLPISALAAGADMVVQSTHKIISGMTQASMLHVRKGFVDVRRVRNILQLLQSTSPSYVLLASLDVARRQMALHGKEMLGRTIAMAQKAREQLNAIPGIACFGRDICGLPGLYDLDVTKLTIRFSGIGMAGFDAIDALHERFDIQSEMATLYNVLEIVTIGNTQRDLDRLVAAVRALAEEANAKGLTSSDAFKNPPLPWLPEAVLTPRDAFFATVKRIPFSDSVGEICAEIISPYPPGIPILAPGERIQQDHVDYLRLIHEYGAFINGPEDTKLATIKVVDR
ncbi:MAG: aminotransferase class I/II-fold pyridoxal phosphate-dependent enzyme [Candidatus Sericytochromatia bacterium]|nr:aminotransferase class I/II-fold pyridoxal phosphate-dependent enzyme [Candidatus Sericytochromatia bacterium]